MSKYKIIIVENDEDERFFMKEGFQSAGLFDLLDLVNNGESLFDWLGTHPASLPDLVLSDLNMPGKNGYDILAELQQQDAYAHIPVIITSTSSNKSTIDKCMNAGAAAYVVKPDTFIEYVPYVKQLHQLIEERELIR